MQFRSVSTPEQYGIMALSDDGTFRVVPSDEFRDEMARLEEVALERSQTFGIRVALWSSVRETWHPSQRTPPRAGCHDQSR